MVGLPFEAILHVGGADRREVGTVAVGAGVGGTEDSPKLTSRKQVLQAIHWYITPAVSNSYNMNRSLPPRKQSKKDSISSRPPKS